MTAPQSFSKTAKDAYETIAELEVTDARQLIDAVVRYYAESGFGDMAAITDDATIADLSTVIQRVAEWESGFQNIKSPSGPWYGYFQNDINVGRGAGYTEDELLDPITNTILAVEELLPLAQQGYATDGVEGAGWNAVVLGQRPLGSQTLRGLPPLAGETEENAAAVRRMAAHAADVTEISSQITAQQAVPTGQATQGGAKERQDYINRCVAAGGGLVECAIQAKEAFPEAAEEEDLTPSDRWAMRSWNEAHPGETITESEIKAAKKIWPDLPVMAAIRKFVEGTAAEGEDEEAVKVTDADRRRVWELGLDLSESEIKEAKRQGIPFEDYALLKETAERLGISSAKLAQALTAAGQDPEAVRAVLDRLEGEAKLADATARVQAARPGMTEAEARAYAEQGLAAGAEPEEIGYAAKNNVPVETLLSLKQQLDQIAEGAADPRTVPTLTDAIEGWTNQQTPQQVAQRRRFEAEVQPWLRRLEGIAERLGKTPQEVYVAARTLGRGDVRAGLEELLKIDARRRKPGETVAQYAQRRIAEGASRKEIQRSLGAQLGEEPSMWEPATGLQRQRYEMRAARERGTARQRGGAVEPKYGMPFASSRQLNRYGETMYAAGLAETYLRTTGPLGTQTQAEWEQQQEAVRGNYPELARRVAEEPLEQMTAGAPSAAPTAAGGAQELTRSTALGTEDVFGPTPRPEDEQLEEDNRQLRRARARA